MNDSKESDERGSANEKAAGKAAHSGVGVEVEKDMFQGSFTAKRISKRAGKAAASGVGDSRERDERGSANEKAAGKATHSGVGVEVEKDMNQGSFTAKRISKRAGKAAA